MLFNDYIIPVFIEGEQNNIWMKMYKKLNVHKFICIF